MRNCAHFERQFDFKQVSVHGVFGVKGEHSDVLG
jgi:hypothetical protein